MGPVPAINSMKENFDKAIAFTLAHEGGYSDNKNDPGGETNFGICKRYHTNVDIKNLTKDKAAVIYHTEYWNAMGCDDLPSPLDIVVFDCAVNPGNGRAAGYLKLSQDWRDILFYRMQYYTCKKSNTEFLHGWINRCIDLWTTAKGME
jgi:hypothetical protein